MSFVEMSKVHHVVPKRRLGEFHAYIAETDCGVVKSCHRGMKYGVMMRTIRNFLREEENQE